jgi:large subunit ribosomal protein L24
MKIKKNDIIIVLAGKDKGKRGKVLQALPTINRVSVEGINILSKHIRSANASKQGQKIEFPSPIQVSNVKIVCPQCSKPTKVGFNIEKESGKKSRICKKCKAVI